MSAREDVQERGVRGEWRVECGMRGQVVRCEFSPLITRSRIPHSSSALRIGSKFRIPNPTQLSELFSNLVLVVEGRLVRPLRMPRIDLLRKRDLLLLVQH